MLTMNDVNGILEDEMGFCPTCHDHTPCGCEVVELCDVCGSDNTAIELLHNDGACFNCNTQLN